MKAKSQVFLYASWGNLILKMQHGTTRQAKQKISATLYHHWSKNAYFFVCKRPEFIHQELKDFVKMTLTRVESFCEKRDSSQVGSLFFSTWLESGPSHQKSWVESSHWLESRYHCNELKMVLSVVSAGLSPGYLDRSFWWKQFPFYFSSSLSVISTRLAQSCCKKYPSLSFTWPKKDQRWTCSWIWF